MCLMRNHASSEWTWKGGWTDRWMDGWMKADPRHTAQDERRKEKARGKRMTIKA